MILFTNRAVLAVATALTLAFGACAASAATLTYQFEGGSLDFGTGATTATVSGSFEFDTVLNLPTTANLLISGAGGLDGPYTVVKPMPSGGLFLRALPTGTDLSSDLTGLTALDIQSDTPVAAGVTLPLFFLGLGTCIDAACRGFDDSGFQSSSFNGPIGNLTPAPAPVPLPAGLPLLLAGLGGFAVLRHRRRAASRVSL